VVPGLESYGLTLFKQFTALTHLALINPAVGYSQSDLFEIASGSIHLHLVVIVVDPVDVDRWESPDFPNVVMIGAVGNHYEFADQVKDEPSNIWNLAEKALREKITKRQQNSSSTK
jgi:hypothetical protein